MSVARYKRSCTLRMKQHLSFVLVSIIMLVMTSIPSLHAALDGYCHNIKDFTMGFQNWCPFNGQKIHGLWPNPDCSCFSEEEFDINSVDPQTRSLMNEHWNECGNNNFYLLEHEWEKHGKCSGLTQAEYFSVTVKLFLDLKGKCEGTCKIKVPTKVVQAMLATAYSDKEKVTNNVEIFEAFIIFSIFCCCGYIAKFFFPHRVVETGNSNRDVEMEIATMPLVNNNLQLTVLKKLLFACSKLTDPTVFFALIVILCILFYFVQFLILRYLFNL